ncbi:OprD family outer membrane porin [Paraburkholderia sp.]|uniref:OprD family outer membrane porin n=1 Tax=Paraburkholderia sp. TaxID=1926495 RepID=UPI00238A32B0|nr:OprD family outer membrane porin [Paraburkholderia sp.]MDE1179357.1 OprD family outer membrane porin [Paraburkholderia sp.]
MNKTSIAVAVSCVLAAMQPAFADDNGPQSGAPVATPSVAAGGVSPAAETKNAVVNAEDAQTASQIVQVSSQAKSQGFIADSHLSVLFRNYSDYADVTGSARRHAWVQSAMLNYESGFTKGLIGFGIDASLYAALKLDGGTGAGNMVHVSKTGNGANQLAWAYPGIFDVKARISETVVRYGEQIVTNPFVEPHDNRALPPTFRGITMTSNEWSSLSLDAGSFDAVRARGTDYLQKLSTSYGGTQFDRLTWFGGNWNFSENGTASLYADQAQDVWKQYYGSVTDSIGSVNTIKWTGLANLYATRGDGENRQGPIDSNAYSLSLSAQHGFSEVLVAYQKILGNQFFDYVNQTNGVYLANSMDVDYNAPHEQSLQLRYTFYGDQAGLPGFKAMLWAVTGWGANASAGASENASSSATYHDLYWKNGSYIQGRHHEIGFMPSYKVQSGRFKGTKVSLFAAWHVGSTYYSDTTSQEYRLTVNMPFKFF